MSENRALSKSAILLAVLVPLALCVACALVFYLDTRAMKVGRAALNETLKPGMTREQVYAQVAKVGSYQVVDMEPRPRMCSRRNPEDLYVELLIVKPSGGLPNFGYEDRYLCFDASGVLIEVIDASF